MSEKVLYVRNIEQAAAWLELDGQISDGMWENARPLNHWQVWCDATVVVAAPGQPVGRTFGARRTRYNFASPELLEVVGARMLGYIRIARRFGLAVAQALEWRVTCEGKLAPLTFAWPELTDQKLLDHMQKLPGVILPTDDPQLQIRPVDVEVALADESYGWRQMLHDLNDLRQIIRERIPACPTHGAQF